MVKKEFIKLPPKFSTNSSSLSTYQNYEVQAKYRDELMEFLKENNIGTIKQWGGFSIPHFKKLGFNIKDYPLTENLFNKLLLLPLNHLISENDVEYVITMVNNFYKKILMDSIELSKFVRKKSIEMCSKGKSSHIASVLSCADLISVIFAKFLNLYPENPSDDNRDRFILSKGHAGAGLYSVLAKLKFVDESLLDSHYQNGSYLSGHVCHKIFQVLKSQLVHLVMGFQFPLAKQ